VIPAPESESHTLSSPTLPSPPVPSAFENPTRRKRQNGDGDTNGSGTQIAGNRNATISVGGSSGSGGGGSLTKSDQIAIGSTVGVAAAILGLIVTICYKQKALSKKVSASGSREIWI
jgi:hypothetical protein